MELTASKDTYITSESSDGVYSGSCGVQRVGRSPVCQGVCRSFREELMLGLSLQKGVGVWEGEGAPDRGNSTSRSVEEARSRPRHWGRSASSSDPMVTLDHGLAGGRTFPPSG